MKKRVSYGVRVLCLLCCLAMLFAFAGCGGGDTTSGGSTASGGSTTTSGDTTTSGGATAERVKKDGVYLTGFPIVDDKVELTIATTSITLHGDFETLPFNQYYEDMTNVHINWEVTPSGDREAVTAKILMEFQSGEMPDIMCYPGFITDEIMGTYGDLCVKKVSDYWEYAPIIDAYYKEHPEILATVAKENGDLYGLPHYQETDPGNAFGDKMWINQKWLDNLGLDMPTTTEELRQVLIAFKNSDPNMNGQPDERPMSSMTANNALMGAFGLTVQGQYDVTINEDGELVYVYSTDSAKEMMRYYNQLYAEGLLDQDFWSHTTNEYYEKIRANMVGVFFASYDYTIRGFDDYDYSIVPPLEGPNGDKLWYYRSSIGDINPNWFVMTNSNEYPEVSMRWMDYFYTNEGRLLAEFGPPGEDLIYTFEGDINSDDGTGTFRFTNIDPPEPNKSADEWRYKLAPGYLIPSIDKNSLYVKEIKPPVEEATLDNQRWWAVKDAEQELMAPCKPTYQLPYMLLSEDDQTIINMYSSELGNYVSGQVREFVMGEKSLDSEWDSYIDELKKRGMDEIVDVMKRNYDLYLQRVETIKGGA